uniref:Uncharacterized protein n=1 Tax=Medicago truncatula TaxID=3880 RepID=I3T4B0_MEDTR|nr:unknown [Medicago truncatula]AFK47352.1 unknown [Medicago truncatula]
MKSTLVGAIHADIQLLSIFFKSIYSFGLPLNFSSHVHGHALQFSQEITYI